jgi:UDP-N-acetylmuramate--alanine ligase
MEVPDLSFRRRVHVIGAGGSGMSAIALVLLGMGHQVSGSDIASSRVLRHLEGRGATVHVGHDPEWLGNADVIVRSTAIPDENPEVEDALRRGLRVWRRAEILAAICAQRRVAAVSGTHGKTTTASLLWLILREAGLHPSMIVGGDIAGIGPGACWDQRGEWMVVEADESDGTFLELGSECVIVTSIEPDHLDFYGNAEALRSAFARFVGAAPGAIVLCADDRGAHDLASRGHTSTRGRLLTYGVADHADVVITDVEVGRTSARFSIRAGGHSYPDMSLAVPGLHNVRNATAALALANAIGVPWEVGETAIRRFHGVARRFEVRGERGGVVFVDDYAHLPGEISAVLRAARAGDWGRIVAVFQPHRFSRTHALWREFSDVFVGADVVFVTDVYGAGEPPRPGVSGELVYRAAHRNHPDADIRYVPTLDGVAGLLAETLQPGDLCLTMGAGDLTTLPDRMLAQAG